MILGRHCDTYMPSRSYFYAMAIAPTSQPTRPKPWALEIEIGAESVNRKTFRNLKLQSFTLIQPSGYENYLLKKAIQEITC